MEPANSARARTHRCDTSAEHALQLQHAGRHDAHPQNKASAMTQDACVPTGDRSTMYTIDASCTRIYKPASVRRR